MIKFILWNTVSALLLVIGIFVVPVALLFTRRTANKLPNWAWPWDNYDPAGDGINGYYKWRDYFDSSSFFRPHYTSMLPRYIWLAFRNPVNKFSYDVLGFTADHPELLEETVKYQWPKNQLIRRRPDPQWDKIGNKDRSGVRYTKIQVKDKVYWEYYRVYCYPFWKTKCLRIRIGWKIGSFRSILKGERVQDVLTINPFSSFKGLTP